MHFRTVLGSIAEAMGRSDVANESDMQIWEVRPAGRQDPSGEG
jgi:hypothetical protein